MTEHGLEAAPRVTAIATPVPSTAGAPIPIGGISFNVIDRSQKVRLTRQRAGGVSLPDAVAHDDSRSYLAGLDLAVGACSLAPFKCSGIDFSNAFMAAIVQGAAGYTEDTTSVNGTGTSTEGPTLSIGTQLNVTTPAWSASPTLPPFRLFAAASFDFTNTSFRKVEGWSSAYRVEPTVGAVLGYQLYLYAGTGWEYLTPSVSTTVSVQGTQVPFRFRTEEEDPWSGVVGLIYRNALAPILLPGFDLIFEGDVGGRTSFQFSLRREIAIGG